MKLLLAYDGSASARAAVRTAGVLLAGAETVVLTVHEAPVRLEHLLEPHTPAAGAKDPRLSDLRRHLEDEAMSVAREGARLAVEAGLAVEAQTAAVQGSPWPAILAEARRRQCAAVICGTRGHRWSSRAWLGSTSSALLHHATLPILVVPERPPDPRGPLLLAYDGSEPARAAVRAAAGLFGGRATVVVRVWESPLRHSLTGQALGSVPISEMRELSEDLGDMLARSAREQAEEGADLARRHGLEARADTVESATRVWSALIEAAGSIGAAVVAVGSRGRGPIASTMLGSVSSGLVHNAELPVLIVPPPGDADERTSPA